MRTVILKDLLLGRLYRTETLLQVRFNTEIVTHVAPELFESDSTKLEDRLELRAGTRADVRNVAIDIGLRRIRGRVAIDLRENELPLDQALEHSGRRIRGPRRRNKIQAHRDPDIGLHDDGAVDDGENAIDDLRRRSRSRDEGCGQHERRELLLHQLQTPSAEPRLVP